MNKLKFWILHLGNVNNETGLHSASLFEETVMETTGRSRPCAPVLPCGLSISFKRHYGWRFGSHESSSSAVRRYHLGSKMRTSRWWESILLRGYLGKDQHSTHTNHGPHRLGIGIYGGVPGRQDLCIVDCTRSFDATLELEKLR